MKRQRLGQTGHVGTASHVSTDAEASPIKRSSRIAARRLATEAADDEPASGGSSPTGSSSASAAAAGIALQRRGTPTKRVAAKSAADAPRPSPLSTFTGAAYDPAAALPPQHLTQLPFGEHTLLTLPTAQHQQHQQPSLAPSPWQLQQEQLNMLPPLQLPAVSAVPGSSSGALEVPTPPALMSRPGGHAGSAGLVWHQAYPPPSSAPIAPCLPSWGSSGNPDRGGACVSGSGGSADGVSGRGEQPWSCRMEPAEASSAYDSGHGCDGRSGKALQPPILTFKRLSLCGSPQVPSQQQQQQHQQQQQQQALARSAAGAAPSAGTVSWGRPVDGQWEAGLSSCRHPPFGAPPAAQPQQICWPPQDHLQQLQPPPPQSLQLQLQQSQQQSLRQGSTGQRQLCDSGSSCGFSGRGSRSDVGINIGFGLGSGAAAGRAVRHRHDSHSRDSSGSDGSFFVCGKGSGPTAPVAPAVPANDAAQQEGILASHNLSYPGRAAAADAQEILPLSQRQQAQQQYNTHTDIADVGLCSSLLQPLTPARDGGASGFGAARGSDSTFGAAGVSGTAEDELALMHRAHEAFVRDGGAEGGAFLAALLVVSDGKGCMQ